MKGHLVILFIAAAAFVGCSNDDHLTEHYWIYDDPIVVEGSQALMCKLGCSGDPIISNIVEVQWNDRAILVATSNGLHYMILAKGEHLQCCSGDSVIGPLDAQTMLMRIKHTDLGGSLKTKKYDN